MTALPNPGTINAAFTDRATAQASSVLVGINVIRVGDLVYTRDATGTALTTRGGQNWSPLGSPRLAHWGITGVPHNAAANPAGNRYMATPTVDETTAIQAAFDWCVSRGLHLSGDPARVYGITAPVVYGSRGLTGGGFTPVRDGAKISDVNLRVIGGTWTPGTFAGTDEDAWVYGDAALVIGKSRTAGGAGKPRVYSERCRVDAARIAPVAIQISGTSTAQHSGHRVERGIEADFIAGNSGDSSGPGGIDSWSNTDSDFTSITGASFLFEERADGSYGPSNGTGWYGLTGRTSHGLVIRGSDMRFNSCMFQTGLHALILGRGFDVQLTGCKFWVGEVRNNANAVAVRVSTRAEIYRFTGGSFQDGAVRIKSFKGGFVGCGFKQFTLDQVRLVATETGETATQFVFVGNRCDEDNAQFLVEGAGTWGDFAAEFGHNNKTDGTAFQFQGKILGNGYFQVNTTGVMRSTMIAPPANSAAPGQIGMFGFGTDDRIYWHNGLEWRRSAIGSTF
jgi:hypothetical protein